MSWIKRNLYFVIGGLVALGLMGYGGFILWTAYSNEGASADEIIKQYGVLDELNKQNPHPGSPGKVDNVKAAKDQEALLRTFITKARGLFVPPPPIPAGDKVDDQKFSNQLLYTIAELNREAKAASVTLPENYAFTFASQRFLTQFDPGSIEPLAMHLGEIKTICDVLFAARINALEGIQREVVSAKDQNVSDYLTTQKTMSTPLGDLTPYRVIFRCFSAELAEVLSGLASSSHGYIVKTINVEPAAPIADAGAAVAVTPVPLTPAPMTQAERYNMRYGGAGGRIGGGPPPVAPVAVAPPPVSKPTVLLNERQLKVTLMIEVVKLKNPDEVAKPKPGAPAAAGRPRNPAPAPAAAPAPNQ